MDGFLSIYLNDQLAMAVLGRQMARRAYRNNLGTPDCDELIDQAAHRCALLETFRASAGTDALAPPPARQGANQASRRRLS